MKTASLFLAVPILLCAQSAHVSPNEFPWRASLDVKETSGYVSVRINRAFYERTEASYADLRLFGPTGTESSYLLRDLHPARPDPSVQSQLIDRVRTPKGQLQFVLDFGIAPPIHNRIVFDTADPDFRRAVLIESSLDRTTWDLVRTAAILRFQQDGQRLESLHIDYPDSARRYLRVTIDSWQDPKTLISVKVQRTASPNAEDWEDLASATPEVSRLTDQNATRFDLSYHFGLLRETRLLIATPSKEFYRSAAVSHSGGGQAWASSGSRVLYRVPGAEELAIRAQSVNTAHIRLDVFDADSQPIEITSVQLQAPAREIVFPISGAGAYTFYLGLAGAAAPRYDLESILDRGTGIRPISLAAPSWESNPAYIPPSERPKPFTERFPWLLPAVVVLAVAAMGAAAYRLIKSPAPDEP
jgi:hypothetical protein